MQDERAAAATDAPWHALTGEEALARLDAGAEGLTEAEAEARRARFGPNELPKGGGGEAWRILLSQLRDPLIYVLLASTALAMLTGKLLDGAVILGVVVLNALIGFIQEYRASQAIAALSQMVPTEVVALRDGGRRAVSAAELVPGDIVFLEAGDKAPADLRLLETRGFEADEAALTGESVPVGKTVDAALAEAGLGDRVGVAHSGSLVTRGWGKGVVVATGAATELGRISRMLDEADALETPLTRQLGVVAKWIAVAIVVVSILLLGLGLWRGYPLADAVIAAVTLAVAAIPEGLPAIVTISLAVGVRRMARRRAVIRKLPAVETLGSTTVICSDKTGTLTRNEMTTQALWTPRGAFRVTGVGYAPVGALTGWDGAEAPEVPEAAARLLRAGALCSDAQLRETPEGWSLAGDPTEGALVTAARKLGQEPSRLREAHPRLDVAPFESERRFMATLHDEPDGARVIYLKGAPEAVLRRCAGDPQPALAAARDIAGEGMRVLAVAAKPVTADRIEEPDLEDGFELLGLQGMIDPPRPEAVEAIRTCHGAGVAVKMITGDHAATAAAIGAQLGLEGGAVEGSELERMEEAELRETAKARSVFARVAPEHKLRLVRALQAEGHVVAMTGDGVNDAPALAQANIGVAMGVTGAAVSKEAADMVLTTDDFASIEAAVEEGRRVYDNLIKALAFVLPTNLGLALIMIASVAAFPIVDGRPIPPMGPAQILWINLVAAVALALPLALEAMEPDVMRRPPRRPDAPVLSPFVIGRTVMVALLMAAGALGLFLWLAPAGVFEPAEAEAVAGARSFAQAQTAAVTTVVFFQIFYLLDCRSLSRSALTTPPFSNPWIWAGVAATLALQAMFVHAPFMHVVFGSAPLDLAGWGWAALTGALILPIVTLEKAIRRRRADR
jgi:Ca2+-transporting ATPase